MNLISFILLITLCLTLINAINVDDLQIEIKDLHIVVPDNVDVYVNNCRYHQGSKRVNCDFVKEEYREKKLYITIPVESEGEFKSNDQILKWDLAECQYNYIIPNDNNNMCYFINELAYTNSFEINEVDDTYEKIISHNAKILCCLFTQ